PLRTPALRDLRAGDQPRPCRPRRRHHRAGPRGPEGGFRMGLTLVQAWGQAKSRLEAAGISGPVIDARVLVEAAADATRADIIGDPHRALSAEQEATLEDYLGRRERREPVSHIL